MIEKRCAPLVLVAVPAVALAMEQVDQTGNGPGKVMLREKERGPEKEIGLNVISEARVKKTVQIGTARARPAENADAVPEGPADRSEVETNSSTA